MKWWAFISAFIFVIPVWPATLGRTDLGVGTDNTDKYENANAVFATESGTITEGCFGGSADSGTVTVYIGLYDYGDGNISGNNRLAVSSGITLTTTSQFVCASMSGSLTANTSYYITGYSNTTGTNSRYSSGVTDEYTNTGAGPASPPDPHATREGTASQWMSFYVTYTPAGAGVAGGSKRGLISSGGKTFISGGKAYIQ